jgi:hypothetical protein
MAQPLCREELNQPVFAAIDAFEYPELHDESVPCLNFFRHLGKLMAASGVKDFGLKVHFRPIAHHLIPSHITCRHSQTAVHARRMCTSPTAHACGATSALWSTLPSSARRSWWRTLRCRRASTPCWRRRGCWRRRALARWAWALLVHAANGMLQCCPCVYTRTCCLSALSCRQNITHNRCLVLHRWRRWTGARQSELQSRR